MTDLKQAALDAARRGFPVFPVAPGAASPPLINDWPSQATTDPETISAWWAQWPEANPAIHVGGAGLVVIDLDEKGGKQGVENFELLQYDEGLAPGTFTVATPSGGRHLYYTAPEGERISNSVERLAQGVDVRAGNGYVVAPGAKTAHGSYTILDERWPQVLPAWIAKRAAAKVARSKHDQQLPMVELDQPQNLQRALDYLEREIAAGRVAIEGEGGNNFTYQTAALLHDFGASEDMACQLLTESGWNAACRPPWSGDELAAIVAHAYEYASRPEGAQATTAEHIDAMVKAAAKSRAEHGAGEPPKPVENPYRLLSGRDLDALPPPAWMIADTIPERSLALIYGHYGTYKSFTALDMALSLAHGQDWQGMEVSRPYRTVYIAGEGHAGLRKRVRAWNHAHERGDIDNFKVIRRMPPFADADKVKLLEEALSDYRPEFVVLDTVFYAMSGLDENSATDAARFTTILNGIVDRFGATVLLIHHAGKDDKKGARGTSALPDAMDVVFSASAGKTSPSAHLNMDKQKDAEKWEHKIILSGDKVAYGDGPEDNSLVFKRQQAVWTTPADSPERLAQAYEQEIVAESQAGREQQEAEWALEAASILDSLDDCELPITPTDLATKVAAGRMKPTPIKVFLREKAWKIEPLVHYTRSVERTSSRNHRAVDYQRRKAGDGEPRIEL